MTEQPKFGTIGWVDLTVENADEVRDFYKRVCGWAVTDISMGEYNDYAVGPEGSDAIAGVCHKRGPNESMPSQWMVYVSVEDIAASISKCEELGGKIVVPTRTMGGHGSFCVIEDPAGAVMALFQPE